MIHNSVGVVKATVAAALPAGAVVLGKRAQTVDHKLLVNTTAPDSGTVHKGVGTKAGILSVVIGPAPAGALRFKGRAYLGGQQYYVTSGVKAFTQDKLSFTANGDLLVDTA
jgi:hypothetical protein